MAIKGQALANFIAEFTSNAAEVIETTNNTEAVKVAEVREKENSVPTKGDAEQWTLYVDGASNDARFGTGMMLISSEGHKTHCAICFGFKASNNDAKYDALIVGLHLTHELQVHNIKIFSNS